MSQAELVPFYSIDKVKTGPSQDGGRFDVRLLRDGLPVAEVSDEGYGGPLMFHWLDTQAPKVAITHIPTGSKTPYTYQGTPEEARLRAHVATLPPFTVEGLSEPLAMCPDVFVGEMVSQAADFKAWRAKLMRLFKTKVYTLDGDDLYEHKVAPSEAQFERARKSFPTRTLLNILPIDEAALIMANIQRRQAGDSEIPALMIAPTAKATPARARRRSP